MAQKNLAIGTAVFAWKGNKHKDTVRVIVYLISLIQNVSFVGLFYKIEAYQKSQDLLK